MRYDPDNRLDWETGRWGVEYTRRDESWGFLLSPDGSRCSSGPTYSDAAAKTARINNKVLAGSSPAEAVKEAEAEDEERFRLPSDLQAVLDDIRARAARVGDVRSHRRSS